MLRDSKKQALSTVYSWRDLKLGKKVAWASFSSLMTRLPLICV